MPDDDRELSERENLAATRLTRFLACGVGYETAARWSLLSSSQVDWHQVDDLLQRGCPIREAVRIAAPLLEP